MKRTGNINKVFLYLWAAAILWIYIGSLVNFHQHKIWGRPLLPQLLYAKRDKEQSVDFKKILDTGAEQVLQPGQFYVTGITEPDAVQHHVPSFIIQFGSPGAQMPVRLLCVSSGLRAPPLS